ncbi:hypothetical protein ACWEAF_38530, partial [Streptomyces sp. NPDC005071]
VLGIRDGSPVVPSQANPAERDVSPKADREGLPKGVDLRTFSQADLDAIAHELNHCPRKTHDYRTPAELYADLLNSGDSLTT